MHHAAGQRGLVAGAIGFVLESHPAVAGLGERAHHPCIEVAGREGLDRQSGSFRLLVGALEVFTIKIRQMGDDLGVEQLHASLDSTRRIKRSRIQLARFKL